MKKIILTVSITSALVGFINAQSFQVLDKITGATISGTTITVNGTTADGDIVGKVNVINNSGVSKSVKITRNVISAVAGTTNSFCWGINCYGPTTTTSPVPAIITAGAIDSSLLAHYAPNATAGTTTIRYRFFDVSNFSDSVNVTINYVVIPSGINELSEMGIISNAYPNPATSFFSIKYDINEFAQKGKIEMYDMLGKNVKEIILTDKQGISKINVSDMNSGIYFYTFIVDNKEIATKKIVISSK